MQKQAVSENFMLPKSEQSELHTQRFAEKFKPGTQPKVTRMRVLFSGHGKAEKNMGLAAIPPLWTPGPPPWR